MRLGDATWNEIDLATTVGRRSDDGTLAPILLIPVGSTEQHGPHLPLATDTMIAEEIAGRAVHRTDGLMIGPTISVSASGEHADFPGTLSIGTATTTAVVVELVRSADWAAGVVLVNGHGGNHRAITDAVATLTAEGRIGARVVAIVAAAPRRRPGRPPRRAHRDLDDAGDRPRTGAARTRRRRRRRVDRRAAHTRGSGRQLPTVSSATPMEHPGVRVRRFITAFVDDLVHQIERWRPIDPSPET